MTDEQTEVLKKGLEALKIGYDYAVDETQRFHIEMAGYKPKRHAAMDADIRQIDDAITAIREALADQPENQLDDIDVVDIPAQQQEPVAVKQIAEALRKHGLTLVKTAHSYHVMDLGRIEAQTTSPPASKPWVGLTNQELIDLTAIYSGAPLYCAIEAKLKEKNT